MRQFFALAFLTGPAAVHAGESPAPAIATRLAVIVEAAVADTGLSINISETTQYSLNINWINERTVCDPASAEDVKRLQEALNRQANIKENYGPAFFSVTAPDGTRKVLSPEQMQKLGLMKECTNIYVSVTPE